MYIAIRTSAVTISESLRERLHDRLASSLERLGQRLNQVHVFFADVNGPKGGIDTICRIVVHVRRQSPLVVEDRHHDLAALADRAVDRVEFAVARRLERWRSRSAHTSMAGEE